MINLIRMEELISKSSEGLIEVGEKRKVDRNPSYETKLVTTNSTQDFKRPPSDTKRNHFEELKSRGKEIRFSSNKFLLTFFFFDDILRLVSSRTIANRSNSTTGVQSTRTVYSALFDLRKR